MAEKKMGEEEGINEEESGRKKKAKVYWKEEKNM